MWGFPIYQNLNNIAKVPAWLVGRCLCAEAKNRALNKVKRALHFFPPPLGTSKHLANIAKSRCQLLFANCLAVFIRGKVS
jgi:hypothetical protein